MHLNSYYSVEPSATGRLVLVEIPEPVGERLPWVPEVFISLGGGRTERRSHEAEQQSSEKKR